MATTVLNLHVTIDPSSTSLTTLPSALTAIKTCAASDWLIISLHASVHPSDAAESLAIATPAVPRNVIDAVQLTAADNVSLDLHLEPGVSRAVYRKTMMHLLPLCHHVDLSWGKLYVFAEVRPLKQSRVGNIIVHSKRNLPEALTSYINAVSLPTTSLTLPFVPTEAQRAALMGRPE